MVKFFLWLFIWPHHAPQPPSGTQDAVDSLHFEGDNPICEKVGDTYFYQGRDNNVGISNISCFQAFETWRKTDVVPPMMDRSE